MLLDPSVPAQTYVEDCEVCCNPLEITPVFEEETLVSCEITPLGQ
jgi:hypothetical protein